MISGYGINGAIQQCGLTGKFILSVAGSFPALEQSQFIEDYWYKIEHQESLHAHNAVVIDSNQ